MINKEQTARSKSFLIMNLNCFVAKNVAQSVAIIIADMFIASGAFTMPNKYKEKRVTSLGIKCK